MLPVTHPTTKISKRGINDRNITKGLSRACRLSFTCSQFDQNRSDIVLFVATPTKQLGKNNIEIMLFLKFALGKFGLVYSYFLLSRFFFFIFFFFASTDAKEANVKSSTLFLRVKIVFFSLGARRLSSANFHLMPWMLMMIEDSRDRTMLDHLVQDVKTPCLSSLWIRFFRQCVWSVLK